MARIATRTKIAGLAVTTALASVALSGCTTTAAPRANLSASKAQVALAKGKVDQAIDHAEAAVLAEPRNPAFRAMLGTAYMQAGRFTSAARSFDDAMALGDDGARTALSLALAEVAAGHNPAALAILADWSKDIPAADLGLATALAGQPEQGIHIMGNAIRGGDNTPKMRQNLAYGYALAGRWKEARLMAAQDVPADQVGDRIAEWAATIQSGAGQARVAALIGAPIVSDPGQPAQLALANNPTIEQLAAEAAAAAPVAPEAQMALYDEQVELAPSDAIGLAATQPQIAAFAADPRPTAAPATFEAAFNAEPSAGATMADVMIESVRFLSEPVIQALPARYAQAKTQPRRAPLAKTPRKASVGAAAGGDHLVQLGSFYSKSGARRAWGIYTQRYSGLSHYEMKITQAVVRGKTYYRVSAAGMAPSAARSMCATVRSSGAGCFAYRSGSPLPGAVESDRRMALR